MFLNTEIKYPWTQGDFNISLEGTQLIREALLNRNLDGAYLNRGNPIPPNGDIAPGTIVYTNLSDKSVRDQPQPEDVTNQDGIPLQEAMYLNNKYGPTDGYGGLTIIDVNKLVRDTQLTYINANTLLPEGFFSSSYTAIEVMNTVNISNGIITTLNSKILDDSMLIKTSFSHLRKNLGFNQGQFEIKDKPDGLFSLNITSPPSEIVDDDENYLSRLEPSYDPESVIPGSYFLPAQPPNVNTYLENPINFNYFSIVGGAEFNQISNIFTQGSSIPTSPFATPAPSESFIAYMGEEQQSTLFGVLNYNFYRPDYTQSQTAFGIEVPVGNYYLGSRNLEPGLIQSPLDAVPADKFGRPVQALVYGPFAIAQQYETVDGQALWQRYEMMDQGRAYVNGGGVNAGFTWVGALSVPVTDTSSQNPGVASNLIINRSDVLPKKKGSILDATQALIDSTPAFGGAKFKHAGNAIDQTAKIFNDGYKNISKGSRVTNYHDGDVPWNCMEYCRVWTKDQPFITFSDLQQRGVHRGYVCSTDSVFETPYNLNIYPTRGKSTSMPTGKNVKKYMFSIENLAWRGTNEFNNLPAAEKGPNGGRIMWFPPYDISIGDTNSAQWNSTNFLGRPEPIYTYNYAERIGTLSFKIVVDHPSVLNVITQTRLKGLTDAQADAALNAFFVGCKEFDLFELAETYQNFTMDELNYLYNEANATDDNDVSNNINYQNTGQDYPAGGNFTQNEIDNLEAQNQNNQNISNSVDGQPPAGSAAEDAQNFQEQEQLTQQFVLKKLLGEANYFEFLEENNPFIYNSIRDQLKYFHPAFHSTTPEGLNSRLTFLIQTCRPGKTIPTITKEGTQIIDADNTAFGPPPICVLRIGDFYHTKIVIDSVSISYEPLLFDLNPDGIGVQPMIADIQMNFKYIGGQGLKAPISRLQNALSFDYFANTEMYDERSGVEVTTQTPTSEEVNNEVLNQEGGSNPEVSNTSNNAGGDGSNPEIIETGTNPEVTG